MNKLQNLIALANQQQSIETVQQELTRLYRHKEFMTLVNYGRVNFNVIQTNPQMRAMYWQGAVQAQDDDAIMRIFLDVLTHEQHYAEFLNTCSLLMNQWQNQKKYKLMHSLAQALCGSSYRNALTYSFLGGSLVLQSQFVAAKDVLEQAVKEFPPSENVLTNLGYVYRALNLRKEGLVVLRKALEVNANVKEIYVNLSNAYYEIGALEEAEKVIQQGLSKFPDYYLLYCNLANLQFAMQKKEFALESAEKAYKLNPDAIESVGMIINLHASSGCLGKAIEFAEANIAKFSQEQGLWVSYAMCLRDAGRVDACVKATIKALSLPNAKKSDAAKNVFTTLLFALNYHADMSARDIYSYYQQFYHTFYANVPCLNGAISSQRLCLEGECVPRKLKVAYVSQFFSNQVAKNFLIPLLENHDRQHFHLTLYSSVPVQDQITEVYIQLANEWVDTRHMSDYELAQRIVADEIDILVDISGHTNGNRLAVFAFKPAPVSLHWLDFGYTTGMPTIDYYVTDKHGVTDHCQPIFAEQLWTLAGAPFAYRPIDYAEGIEPSSLPYDRNGFMTFGCLSRAIRINYKVIHVWAVILKSVPHSVLMLNSANFSDASVMQNYVEQFEQHGVSRDRIKMGFDTPSWKPMQEIDIMLDCFPHNSGMTLVESLYMGVPFVTLASRPSVGLIGSSILHAVGMSDWIAKTEREYANKAIQAAHQPDGLRALRANLRGIMQQSLLMDEKAFALSMENAYREMWRKFCEKQAVKSETPQP